MQFYRFTSTLTYEVIVTHLVDVSSGRAMKIFQPAGGRVATLNATLNIEHLTRITALSINDTIHNCTLEYSLPRTFNLRIISYGRFHFFNLCLN